RVRDFDRVALLRARRQQSAAAGLVRAHRTPRRQGPLLSLRRLECRQLPRVAFLSVHPGTDAVAAPAHCLVGRRLLAAVCADRGVWLAVAALSGAPKASPPPTWAFLAAVPSGLLVAVTAYMSTDIAAAPLLWVMPLSLYLLTWVLVFQSRPLLPHRWILRAQPFAIAGIVVLLAYNDTDLQLLAVAAHLIAFFMIAMASHGELARLRPPAQHLTTF